MMGFREERWRRFLDAELGRPERRVQEGFARPWGGGLWIRGNRVERRGLKVPRRWWQWR